MTGDNMELVQKYRKRLGWDDQTTLQVLCDCLDTHQLLLEIVAIVNSPGGPEIENFLESYLEQRALEEEGMTDDT